MPKLSIVKGTSSKLVQLFIQDTTSTSGGGLSTLVYNSTGLTAFYYREGATSSTAITLATMTLGTWASGGFIAVDSANLPGVYQLGLPNAALASGANSCMVMMRGATNMAPVLLEVELTATNNQDSVAFGLSSLPAGATMVKRNQALAAFEFLMVSSADHVTPKTGLTVTAQRSIDGAALAACANSPTEIGSGLYALNLAASDLNGGMITLVFTAAASDNRYVSILTQP